MSLSLSGCCDNVGPEIKETITEAGVRVDILTPDGEVFSPEYILESAHPEHTTPMIRAFFSDYVLWHDTNIRIGDVIDMHGKRCLVMVKEPEYCGDYVIDYLASGYTVNIVGTFQDYNQNPGYDSDYVRRKAWTDSYTEVPGVIVDRLFRSHLADIGFHNLETEVEKEHLYVAGHYQVEAGMRFISDSGKRYRVEYVETSRFPGINVCFVSNDARD